MATDTADTSGSLWNSLLRITEKLVSDGGHATLINILALFCLISILQRNGNTGSVAAAPSTAGGLGKLLTDLTKGDGTAGASSDALLSLLPLLNSPQMKSKLNPTTIATVLGLLNSMGGGEKNDHAKQDKSDAKGEPAALPVMPEAEEAPPFASNPAEKKTANSRYLNWKSSF
ncbi:MAG: hypothetical protein E6X17_16470 [Sporomusaceae bacterium]|nr:hypothetical protein [Sporomusaceae bacterium]